MEFNRNCAWVVDTGGGIYTLTDINDRYVPKDAYGFVYMIRNASKNKFYIGQKQLISDRWKRVGKSTYEKLKKEGAPVKKTKSKAKSKPKKPVWIYKTHDPIETDWLCYTGSNKQLNEDIANGDVIEKTILHWAYFKRQLTYLEAKALFGFGVLENPRSYNDNILGAFFTNSIQ